LGQKPKGDIQDETMRKGKMLGHGKGYYNYKPMLQYDRRIHQMSGKGIRQPQRFITSTMKNLPMNPDTYKLRRKVIDLLYEVKVFRVTSKGYQAW
jgi:hypothetical protein